MLVFICCGLSLIYATSTSCKTLCTSTIFRFQKDVLLVFAVIYSLFLPMLLLFHCLTQNRCRFYLFHHKKLQLNQNRQINPRRFRFLYGHYLLIFTLFCFSFHLATRKSNGLFLPVQLVAAKR